MAKATMKWTLVDTILNCEHVDSEDGFVSSFDLALLFTGFADFEEVQKETVVYGIKQKLADSCARPKDQTLTVKERMEQLKETWEMIAVDRKWTSGERGGGVKGPKTALGTVVKNGLEMGMTAEQIAMLTNKSVEIINRVIDELA